MRLLAADRDTLISRKNSESVAEEVRYRASRVDSSDISQRVELDEFLRSDGNRLNPGTTADLIAAALFVLFRSLPESRIVAST
jgi:triphosphoribosyl-dephospho-CoA synthase